jgi:ribosome-associated protein
MTTSTPAKGNIQKLQRAIVDGLEDVKAQDIQVFDTEKLSALFERVIIASGTSNRQTKALASSVMDSVREAGFPKPRMEGQANGEWIIVDCGQAVVHVMQPSFRQYYNLEELWGEKPVRLKLGAAKPVVKEVAAPATAKTAKAKAGEQPASLRRSSAAKKGVTEAFPSKAQEKAAAAKAAGVKTAAKKAPAKKSAAKKVTSSAAPATGDKTSAKTTKATKPAVAKVVVPAAKKVAAKKAVARKAPAKKAAPKA